MAARGGLSRFAPLTGAIFVILVVVGFAVLGLIVALFVVFVFVYHDVPFRLSTP